MFNEHPVPQIGDCLPPLVSSNQIGRRSCVLKRWHIMNIFLRIRSWETLPIKETSIVSLLPIDKIQRKKLFLIIIICINYFSSMTFSLTSIVICIRLNKEKL